MDGRKRKRKKAVLDLVKPNSTKHTKLDRFSYPIHGSTQCFFGYTDRILVYGTTTKTCTEGLVRQDKKAKTRSERDTRVDNSREDGDAIT